MTLFVLAYLGGALTILAPCILPIIPFVFARADQPFARSGLPLLGGMAITFACVGSLGAVAGEWAVHANEYGRFIAIVLLTLLGLSLLAPQVSQRLSQPLVALGARLSSVADLRSREASRRSPASSFLLGVATGLLWAPCAGPILGLVLAGAAIQGPTVKTTLLLLSYAAGAMTSLSIALLLGGRLFAAMKRSLGMGEWIRRTLGAGVLAGVLAIAFGLDTGVLAQLSSGTAATIEKTLYRHFRPDAPQAPDPKLGQTPFHPHTKAEHT